MDDNPWFKTYDEDSAVPYRTRTRQAHNSQRIEREDDGPTFNIPSTNNFFVDSTINHFKGIGTKVVNEKMSKYSSVLGGIKDYFQVSNQYVLQKLMFILFPFYHKKKERNMDYEYDDHNEDSSRNERDLFSIDYYIPLLSFITYCLLSILINPKNREMSDIWGREFFWMAVITLFESGLFWMGLFLFGGKRRMGFFDLMGLSGYKWVGITLTIVAGVFGNITYWIVLVFLSLCMSALIQKTITNNVREGEFEQKISARKYFIFFASLVQLPLFLLMTK